MGVVKPALPDLDLDDWAARPERERVRLMCQSWATQGFGAPLIAYVFYVAKVAVYVAVWVLFVMRSPDVSGLGDIDDWWFTPIAFEKAIVWTMLFEVLGLGCGSGPLTGRYVPPIVAPTHFLRPGTIRLPAFPARVPLTAGHRRTLLDVVLYLAVVVLAVRALLTTDALHRRQPALAVDRRAGGPGAAGQDDLPRRPGRALLDDPRRLRRRR